MSVPLDAIICWRLYSSTWVLRFAYASPPSMTALVICASVNGVFSRSVAVKFFRNSSPSFWRVMSVAARVVSSSVSTSDSALAVTSACAVANAPSTTVAAAIATPHGPAMKPPAAAILPRMTVASTPAAFMPVTMTAIRGPMASTAALSTPTAIAVALMGPGRLEKNFAAGSTTRSIAVRAGTSVPPISSWRSPKACCARARPPAAVAPKASPVPPALDSRAAMIVSRSVARSPVATKLIPSSLSARALPMNALPMASDASTTSRPVRMAKSLTRGNSPLMAVPVRSKRARVAAAAARRSSSVPVSDCNSDASARMESMGTSLTPLNFW